MTFRSFISVRSVAVVLAALIATAVQAEPRQWLDQMNRAFAELSYDGTFSYFGGNDMASLRLIHKVVDGEQRERLIHLNGEPREIVRHGDEVACIVMPGDDLLALESSIPAGPFARAFVRGFDRIDGHYQLSERGRDRVAGREAVRIDVSPRQGDRFSHRLWLDAEHSLLLRSELLSEAGKRLEIFQFNQITFGDAVDDALLETPEKQDAMVSHLRLGEPSAPVGRAEAPWRTGWLPDGFSMSAADIRRTPKQLSAVYTLVYSDGLVAFSVFIESMPPQSAKDMHMRVGATVSVNKLVNDAAGVEHLVTLVGELPDATALRILAGIQPAS